ncbi:MAG TPA: helix-hairpin-helix domain-containing protein [Chthoniobacterales bacterium]|jgi:DNA polymerase (family 10)|nr:helix-hairpin-helix domain-containing protein [Chthoniobacterales bacterium]
MDKATIAGVLEKIGTLLELKGENPFKIRAYVNAARSLETWGGNIADLANEETLEKIPGIGKAIAAKIKELVDTGSLKFFDELRAEFPADILEMFSLPGLGAKKIKALLEKLRVSSIAQLHEACVAGRIAELPGFGKATQEKLCKAIDERQKYAGKFQLGQIAAEAETLLNDLRGHPDAHHVCIAGSYRRRKEIVRDLDFIVATSAPAEVSALFVEHPLVESIIAQGSTKSSVRLRSGIQCDLRVVTAAEYPFALNYFTGSKEHNVVVRSRALKRGWTLNEYRLGEVEPSEGGSTGVSPVRPTGVPPVEAAGNMNKAAGETPASRTGETPVLRQKVPVIREEADLYRALDLDYIPPELRENCGEFEAAAAGKLPRLVEAENLRGTFHCHTTASDGRNSLEEMAAAAQELGLQYLGIADHSRSSIQARGLDEARLRVQLASIRKLNSEFENFRLFAGVECDILRDGSLDFPDELLAELDYVVASVHSAFTLPEAEMTKRMIRAMENPHVTMLAHPTGRLLLRRDPYAVDIPAIIDAAAETGTWIEINAAPKRLDLDWRWWPLAKEKGVKCVINPDAHAVERLQELWFGVGVARKGWLTRDDVMNCLPLGKIEGALREKRGRRME